MEHLQSWPQILTAALDFESEITTLNCFSIQLADPYGMDYHLNVEYAQVSRCLFWNAPLSQVATVLFYFFQ